MSKKLHLNRCISIDPGLVLLTLSWDKNWDSHSLVNGYPSFYPRIALVAPSPAAQENKVVHGLVAARGGYSVRFRIGMLLTARRLKTLQGSKRGVETIHFAQF